jgi:FkbM family methyltransferase
VTDAADKFDLFGDLLDILPDLHRFHSPTTPLYRFIKHLVAEEAKARFGPECSGPQDFGRLGKLTFPFVSMGAINSLDLFGLDELIIFSFYQANRDRYRRVADIGANIGLHSTILDRYGYEVHAYEPDPEHIAQINQNLSANNCGSVTVFGSAVSDSDGSSEFVRVLGNTTGSHISGSKQNPYGQLERFEVKTASAGPIFEWADLVKLDVEGHEKDVLLATTKWHWEETDTIAEIGSEENASAVHKHMSSLGVNMFAQKLNWGEVRSLADMPVSYRDGSLFITAGTEPPWR